ncbi:MAG: hypothetical protein MUC99_13310, partial [Anaerolineae bacterium]|nr:hypothetical protein [Anaerolineae bacterium]
GVGEAGGIEGELLAEFFGNRVAVDDVCGHGVSFPGREMNQGWLPSPERWGRWLLVAAGR